jgi:hypothetical protein
MGLEPTTFCMAIDLWFPLFDGQASMVEPMRAAFTRPPIPEKYADLRTSEVGLGTTSA